MDHASILLDDSAISKGIAFVYKGGRMFVTVECPVSCEDDPALLSSETVIGEIRDVTPTAACLLTLLCDVIYRVTSTKRPKAKHVALRTIINCASSSKIEELYQTTAAQFSSSVQGHLYHMSTMFASPAYPRYKAPTKSAAKAAAKAPKPAAIAIPVDEAPVHIVPPPTPASDIALLSLCATIRERSPSAAILSSKVILWQKMMGKAVRSVYPPAPGIPGRKHSVEMALGEIVAHIRLFGWSSDVIRGIEAEFDLH